MTFGCSPAVARFAAVRGRSPTAEPLAALTLYLRLVVVCLLEICLDSAIETLYYAEGMTIVIGYSSSS